MSKIDEVTELRAHIARLESELEQARNPVPVNPDVPMNEVAARFRMPSRRQGEALLGAAGRMLSTYAKGTDLEHFLVALNFLGAGPCQVVDTLNEEHYAGHWLDIASDWTRASGQDIGLPALLLACAAGRVPYRLTDPRVGAVCALGLVVGQRSSYGGGAPSRPLRNTWLYTAESGQALPPTPARPLPKSPVRTMQLNLNYHRDNDFGPTVREL